MDIQSFNDPTGKTSISRILYAFGVVVVILLWAGLSWKNGYFIDIDPGVIGLLGTLAVGKIGTAFAEKK